MKLGDSTLKPLTSNDIPRGADLVSAWPMAPADKLVRSGNRLNEILLVRLDPAPIAGQDAPDTVDNVVAFSALCPHTGCNVTTWLPEKGILSCDCHLSDFDARARGKVVDGPSSRALPLLPLERSGDVLVVAAAFAAPIRFDE